MALILYIYEPDGGETNLFNVLAEGASWEASTIYDAPANGEYFPQADNMDGQWTATFEPF